MDKKYRNILITPLAFNEVLVNISFYQFISTQIIFIHPITIRGSHSP